MTLPNEAQSTGMNQIGMRTEGQFVGGSIVQFHPDHVPSAITKKYGGFGT